jgi:SAM-dependent methyltransferase
MVPCEIVTTVVPREPLYPGRHVNLPRLTTAACGTKEHDTWVHDHFWMVDYQVLFTQKAKALALAEELRAAFNRSPDHPEIPRLVSELKALHCSPEDRTPLDEWRWMAYQMPDDIGGGAETKKKIRAHLSDRYAGCVNILEAMCGFNSYLAPRVGQTVIALDYCREALERYPYPERKRVRCDLNQLSDDEQLECFGDEQFDAISICFGFRYLHDPVMTFRSLRRSLKENGVLSFVENPGHGYNDICRREFSPDHCERVLWQAGFRSITRKRLPFTTDSFEKRSGYYFYHVEARSSPS